MDKLFTFEFINDQLLNMGAVHSASELQGMLCGILSAGKEIGRDAWIESAKKFLDLEFLELSEEQRSVYELLYKETQVLITDDHFRFTPLLPGDEVELYRRAEELGAWCSGYLHGLGLILAGGEDKKLSNDVADAMRDIANISQVAVGEEDGIDENEAYWSELVEYVKVAVLTVYNEHKKNPPIQVH